MNVYMQFDVGSVYGAVSLFLVQSMHITLLRSAVVFPAKISHDTGSDTVCSRTHL